jgi:hypothetical protein
MVALWWEEARRYGVLPLDDRDTERALAWSRTHLPLRHEFQQGMARIDRQLVPAINDRSWRIRARIQAPADRTCGIILSCGNRFAGYLLYCSGGRVHFDYVATETVTHALHADLPAAGALVEVVLQRTGERSGILALLVDGTEHGSLPIPRTWTVYVLSAGLTCGWGSAPVVDACPPPSRFTGSLREVTVEIEADSPADHAAFAAALRDE